MKIAALPLLLISCGTSSGGSSASSAPTVKSALLLMGQCSKDASDFGCQMTIMARASDENFDNSKYGLVWTWSLSGTPTACTVENSQEMKNGSDALPLIPFNSLVSARACILTRSSMDIDQGLGSNPIITPTVL